MKKILIIVAVVVLLAGGGVTAYFLLGAKEEAPAAAGAEGAEGEAAAAAEPAEPEADPIYLGLDPNFVVNFEHKGQIRYLQLSLQIMAYDQAVIDKVQANMPAVRNKLILLFTGQDYEALQTLEGKEALRAEVLTAINESVRLTGSNSVAEVFFTGFVMQ
jgi:flagellar FliL protein